MESIIDQSDLGKTGPYSPDVRPPHVQGHSFQRDLKPLKAFEKWCDTSLTSAFPHINNSASFEVNNIRQIPMPLLQTYLIYSQMSQLLKIRSRW